MSGHRISRRPTKLRPDGVRITESLRNGLAGFDPGNRRAYRGIGPAGADGTGGRRFRFERLNALGADVVYGCVEKQTHLAAFPTCRTPGRGCATEHSAAEESSRIKPRALPSLERFIERLGAARKHPFRLASLFGWDVLARFAIGRLTIAQAEARASRILGAPVRALVSPYPETAVNVDRESDVELARRLVADRAV